MQQGSENASPASMGPGQGIAAGGATLTDEQILGMSGEESETSTEKAGEGGEILRPEQVGAQNDAAAPPRQSQQGSGEAAAHAPVPEWLKPLFADGNLGPRVQSLWDQHQAYREIFPTVAEARTIKELFPGGAEDAKKVLAASEEVAALDGAYYSNDPAVQAQLAANLLQDDPAAFRSMLSQSARVLAERDPAAYYEVASGLLITALESQQFDRHLELMSQARERGDTSRLSALTDQLVRWAQSLGIGRNGAQRPEAQPSELLRQREQLEREQGEFRAAQYEAFQHTANQAVIGQVRQTIEQTLAGVLPATVSEGARKRIAEDVFNEINTTLQADAGLTRQVAAILRQWRFDEENRQQVVNLIFNRAKTLVPTVAKRILSDWTGSVLSAHRQKSSKQQTAANRVDIVGGGAPETTAHAGLRPRDIDYTQTSDEQILSW